MEEVKKEPPRKSHLLRVLFISIGIIIFVPFIVGLSTGAGKGKTLNQPQIGETYTLNYNDDVSNCDGKVVVPIDEKSQEAYGKAAVAKDNEEIAMMVLEGNAFFVPNCTTVKVIDRNMYIRKIRIMDGEQTLKTGWVPNEYLK
ncbi:MAG: hypothetical protein NTZ13_01815 [Candidatus Parcubacteria bacterium]|nr:hypothetical protein [Candidatus Parcubacteria bacterium]